MHPMRLLQIPQPCQQLTWAQYQLLQVQEGCCSSYLREIRDQIYPHLVKGTYAIHRQPDQRLATWGRLGLEQMLEPYPRRPNWRQPESEAMESAQPEYSSGLIGTQSWSQHPVRFQTHSSEKPWRSFARRARSESSSISAIRSWVCSHRAALSDTCWTLSFETSSRGANVAYPPFLPVCLETFQPKGADLDIHSSLYH